ncbi:MAG: TonB-dependent receptor plug domain-containing protein, partial [Pseudomonadota bacterium]
MTRNTKLSHYAARVAALVTGLAVYAGYQPAAVAQEGGEQRSGAIEEILVSARRVEESLQDAAVTVTALDTTFLNEQGINQVNDVILFAPGANFTAFNKMQAEFSLRGVSSQSEGASGDSSIVTVIDNVVVSKEFMKNPLFFDMERVEILRGPQGTTFGRNASSGLIHLITKRPTDQNSVGVMVDAGNREILNVEGFVNGSITDNLNGRFAARLQSHGGFTDDWVQSGRDLGAEQAVAFRGSLVWVPSDTVSVFLKAEYNEDDDENPAIRRGRDCSIVYQGDFPDPSIVGAPQPPWSQFPNWSDSCDPWEST